MLLYWQWVKWPMRKVSFAGRKEWSALSVDPLESLKSLVWPAALMFYALIYTACPTPNAERQISQLTDEHWTIKPLRGQIFPLGVGGEHVNNEVLLAKPQMLMLLKIFPSNMIAQTANVHKHLSMCAVHTVHKAHISFMWMQLCMCALYIQTLYAFSNPLYVSFHLSPQGHVLKDAVNTGCRLH